MARNVADFMYEIFNGVDGATGVIDRLDNKLDKTATAASAAKLSNSRSLKVSLASNLPANFDGSANVTIGVDGILPASHGGTGVSNLQNLNVGFATTASVAATSNFATRADQDCDGNKISTKYLTKTAADGYYLGKTATAAAATKATQDGSGNNIANTYARKSDIPTPSEIPTIAAAARQATLDGEGNIITSTYAKSNQNFTFRRVISLHDPNETAADFFSGCFLSSKFDSETGISENTVYGLRKIELWNAAGQPFVIDTRPQDGLHIGYYEFKDDGIYLNGTKITN